MRNKLTRCRMARFDVYIVTRQIKFAIISERNAVSFEYFSSRKLHRSAGRDREREFEF